MAEHVEFQISGDGGVVWFHTEKRTKLYIGQIEGPIRVNNGRKAPREEPPGDAGLLEQRK